MQRLQDKIWIKPEVERNGCRVRMKIEQKINVEKAWTWDEDAERAQKDTPWKNRYRDRSSLQRGLLAPISNYK